MNGSFNSLAYMNDLHIHIRQNENDSVSLILPTKAYFPRIEITILFNIRHFEGSYRTECQ